MTESKTTCPKHKTDLEPMGFWRGDGEFIGMKLGCKKCEREKAEGQVKFPSRLVQIRRELWQ